MEEHWPEGSGQSLESNLVTHHAQHVAFAGDAVTSFFGTDQVLGRRSWQPLWLGCKNGQPLGHYEHLTAFHIVADHKKGTVKEAGKTKNSIRNKKAASGVGYVYTYDPIPEKDLDGMLDGLHISIEYGPFQPVSRATIGVFVQRIDALWHAQATVSVRVKYTDTTRYVLKLRFVVTDTAAPATIKLNAAGIVTLANLRRYGGVLCPAKLVKKELVAQKKELAKNEELTEKKKQKKRGSSATDMEQALKKQHTAAGAAAAPRPAAAAAGGGAAPDPSRAVLEVYAAFRSSPAACPADYDTLPEAQKHYLLAEWVTARK
jgi:hypothetical protein